MKRLIFTLIVLALMATPALASPTLDFAQDIGGNWYFDAGSTPKTFTYNQPIQITAAQGGTTDGLVGMNILLPTMNLGGSSGAWTVTGGTVVIEKNDGTDILTGTLTSGDLVPVGNLGNMWTVAGADITWNTYPLGPFSPIADDLWAHGIADFDLTLNAGSSVPGGSFDAMLQGTTDWQDGLSGSITIPAPGAIILGSLGVGLVGWLRRRRTL